MTLRIKIKFETEKYICIENNTLKNLIFPV